MFWWQIKHGCTFSFCSFCILESIKWSFPLKRLNVIYFLQTLYQMNFNYIGIVWETFLLISIFFCRFYTVLGETFAMFCVKIILKCLKKTSQTGFLVVYYSETCWKSWLFLPEVCLKFWYFTTVKFDSQFFFPLLKKWLLHKQLYFDQLKIHNITK